MKTLAALLATIAVIAPGLAQDISVDPASGAASLGYKTVAEALASVSNKPGAHVTITQPEGWTIIFFDAPEPSVWSFTPAGHYAHPAVVRRTVVQENGVVSVRTTALCQAAKEPCDRLMAEFKQLDARVREDVRSRSNR